MNNKKLHVTVLGILCAALFLTMYLTGPANAAPNFAVTPVTFANNGSRAQEGARIIPFFDGTPAAYLTPVTNCYDTRNYNTLDVVYTSASVAAITIDQVYGNDTTVLAAGASVLNSATPVVTPVAVQVPNFNAFNCFKVGSANGTPVSVYLKANVK